MHNGGPFLSAAVTSLLTQSFPALEIILIDDHSTDDAIVRLPRHDPRLRIFQARGQGLVSALNQSLHLATGDYVARMDGDDISLPQRLQTQLTLAHHHSPTTLIGARVEMFSDDGDCAGGYLEYERWINGLIKPDDISKAIFIESPIPHPTLFCRRDTLLALDGYRDKHWPEDYDLWMRAHQAGCKFAKPEETLLRWRDHPDRLSRTDPSYASNQFVQLKAHFLARQLSDPVIIWGAGRGGKRLSDALARQGVATRSFIDVSQKRIGGKARGRDVLPPHTVSDHDAVILVAVGRRGVRPEIREYLTTHGRQEGVDYWFTA